MGCIWSQWRKLNFPRPRAGLLQHSRRHGRGSTRCCSNKGTLDGQRILSAAAVDAMTSSQTGSMKAGFAPGVGHGFGFEVVRETLAHSATTRSAVS